MSKRKWSIFAALIVLIASGSFVGWRQLHNRQAKPTSIFSASLRSSTAYPLFEPKTLPPGYAIAYSTISSNDQATLFDAKNSAGDVLHFSLQAKPKDYDFEQFYRETLKSPVTYVLPIGQATVGKINRGVLASVETDKTWILINSLLPLEYDQLKPMLLSLQPSPD